MKQVLIDSYYSHLLIMTPQIVLFIR